MFGATPALAGSWLLGFSPADTLPPGAFSAISGTGGQVSSVGDPRTTSFTPFLAHAGIRVGLADGWDVGYRLATVALPFSTVGPSLGSEIDLKHRLTPKNSPWQVALVGGVGYAYLDIQNMSRSAWSPGADLIVSRQVTPKYTVFADLRYVYTFIESGQQAAGPNHFQAFGPGAGVKVVLTKRVSLTPEIGAFDFQGRLTGDKANGFGFQYGAVLGFRF
ncbi:MAG: hypothetical protein KGL69_00335 [Alphaproteobacteria bacterium]|nr:hypothetical protein [Alphaproteobacteria bacterium]